MILTIHRALKDRLRAVLMELYGLDPDATPEIAVQYPPNRTLGDLGIPIAFELARTLRKAPKAIATEVVAALGPIDGIARAEAAPNGYVNVFFDRATFLRKACTTPAAGATAPAAQTKTIVEHTAINPNKAAHIGHVRNSALGDTLVRVLRFLGTPVEVQNYIDDTGVQVADVAVGFEQLEHASIDDVTALAAKPRFDFYCWDLYARVTEWYTGDDDRLAHRTRALRDLEAGDTPTAAIGQAVAAHIVRCHLATMDRLNVEYDLLSWEGDILRLEFWARAFAVLQEADAIFLQTDGPQAGCWVMPLAVVPREDKGVGAEAGDATGQGLETPAKIIVRSNGTVTYVGKDIAYQFWKFGVLDRDFRYRHHSNQRSGRALWSTTAESIARTDGPVPPAFGDAAAVYNVIDTRQSYLQELLKQALRAIDRQPQADRSVHVSYEMVALSHGTARALGHDADPDERRPFVEVSGRKGLGVKADDLLDRVTAAARREVLERHVDLTENEAEAERIAAIIAVAAIRYFMIKYSRGKLIVFDIDEALSFEGESGPYVQYAAVRAEKILDKLRQRHGTDDTALVDALATLPDAALDDPNGTDPWALVLEAARLDEVAAQSVRALELSVLAKYAFGLAQAFNTFYHRCPVIAEERRDVRLWRAAAVTYARLQLGRALDLMGCEVPPRM